MSREHMVDWHIRQYLKVKERRFKVAHNTLPHLCFNQFILIDGKTMMILLTSQVTIVLNSVTFKKTLFLNFRLGFEFTNGPGDPHIVINSLR